MSNRLIVLFVALVSAAGALLIWDGPAPHKPHTRPVDYLRIVREVQLGNGIRDLKVVRGDSVTLEYAAPNRAPLVSAYPDERSLHDLILAAQKSKVAVYPSNPTQGSLWRDLLIQLVPPLLFLLLIFFVMARTSGLGKLLRNSRFNRRSHDVPVTFADVAGLGEARGEVQEVVEFLEDPARFSRLGARVPRGILFVGPPGTGKTLLARAAAGESGSSFFSLTGSDFVEMLAGLGASRVRDLFKEARQHAPSIIFIDEIDAVGRARSNHGFGGHEEREQTLNQLLSEMDGFEAGEAVVVIAATNRPDILDAALLRPGRFDRQILIDRPDVKGREEILRVHAKGKPISEADLPYIAAQTPGFTGAELANVLNEAALIAVRRDLDAIDRSCLQAAMERVIAGLEKSRVISDHEREVIAYHEVGHALCAHFGSSATPVHKISVVSRGMALGYTISIPEQDRLLETRESFLAQLTVLLGGRAAELERFGEFTSGAADDLRRATDIAVQMVTRLGMSPAIGPRVIAGAEDGYTGSADPLGLRCAPETAALVDAEVKAIIEEALGRARELIVEQREALDRVARRLMEQETLDREEFEALLDPPAKA